MLHPSTETPLQAAPATITRAACRVAGAAVLAAAVGSAAAQTSPAAPAAPPSSPWSFYITPYAWLSGIGGSLQAPYRRIPSQSASVGFGSVMSHLNTIPFMGAAEIRHERFGLAMDLMAVSLKTNFPTDNILYSGGTARVRQLIGSALLAYRVVDEPSQGLDLGVGFRAISLDNKLTTNAGLLPGFERTPGASWANPIVAIRYRLRLADDWSATFYGDIGGGGSGSFTWQLFGTIDYSVTDTITLRAGYRHLQYQYTGERLRTNISLSGPIIGATFRF